MNKCQHPNVSKEADSTYYCEDCNSFLSVKEYNQIGLTQCPDCDNMLATGEVCWGSDHKVIQPFVKVKS